MWWVVYLSLSFVLPAAEMADEWRLHRSADKDLIEMRKHVASGEKWDVTRGRWIANDDGTKRAWRVTTAPTSMCTTPRAADYVDKI